MPELSCDKKVIARWRRPVPRTPPLEPPGGGGGAASPAACGELLAAAAHLRHEFQPIVALSSGTIFGFEALLRGYEHAGFPSILALFDRAWEAGCLNRFDRILRRKAAAAFSGMNAGTARLFYNIDVRMFQAPDFPGESDGATAFLDDFRAGGLESVSLCIEIGEHHVLPETERVRAFRNGLRRQGCQIAIDDFGTGTAGLRLLYEQQPNLLKVDRFFIAELERDERKRLYLTTVVSLAHMLGMLVVAEGVETEAELLFARKIGCDLVQGFGLSPPLPPGHSFHAAGTLVAAIARRERHGRRSDRALVEDGIEAVPPLVVGDSMATVFQTFRQNKERSFFPLLDAHHWPLGIIRETDLKDFIYSRYGRDLLNNKSLHRGVLDFLTPCPVCDVDTEAEKILEIYSQASDPVGIIVVDALKYVGVLSATSLLRVINEKNLALARDQNPLTRLPGNTAIDARVAVALEDRQHDWVFVYLDLDNFKPFNDTYGFRQGDRIIVLLADLLRARFATSDTFVGHIGGDDFFVSLRDVPVQRAVAMVAEVLDAFRADAVSFHDAEARRCGYIVAQDRHGETRRFPLISCSAAMVAIPHGLHGVTADDLVATIAELKKTAKQSPDHRAVYCFGCDDSLPATAAACGLSCASPTLEPAVSQ